MTSCLKSGSCVGACAFFIFTSFTITVGVLIVYLTSQKQRNGTCELNFRGTAEHAISYDSRPRHVAVGDFNQNGHLDIVVDNSGADNIGILLGYDNGKFTSQITYSPGLTSRPYAVVVGDFNNDNQLDIAVANSGASNVGIFLGNGNGIFTTIIIYPTGSNSRPRFIVVSDFTKDTKLDIVVVDSGNDNVLVLQGDGNFTIVTTHSVGSYSDRSAIAIGDFDNDTIPDIVVANTDLDSADIFLNLGNGTFGNQTEYPTEKDS